MKETSKCWDFFPSQVPYSLFFLFFYKAKYLFDHILFHFVHSLTSISVVPQSPNHSRLRKRDTWLHFWEGDVRLPVNLYMQFLCPSDKWIGGLFA